MKDPHLDSILIELVPSTAGMLKAHYGITWNSYRPLCVMKAVFSCESGCTAIYDARSRVEK